jgi:hypothetical protein
MGIKSLTRINFGIEATLLTHVAADTVFGGGATMAIPMDHTPVYPDNAVGLKIASRGGQVHSKLVTGTINIPNFYFQLAPALFSCGVAGSITPAEQTPSQNDYLYAFAPSLTAIDTPDSMTVECGDNSQAHEFGGGVFMSYTIAGEVGSDGGAAAITCDAEYFGDELTDVSFTGSLSLPTETPCIANLVRLYKDSAWAGVGTTELTSTLRGFEISIVSGQHPKFFGSANKTYDAIGQDAWIVMLTLDLERGTNSLAIQDDFQADPHGVKAYRLKIEGPQLGTGDTHSIIFDMLGDPQSFEPIATDIDGNNIDRVVLLGVTDDTNAWDLNVTTNVSAI